MSTKDIIRRLRRLRSTEIEDPSPKVHKYVSSSGEVLDSPRKFTSKRPDASYSSRLNSSTDEKELYVARGLLSPPRPESRSRDSSRRSHHHSKRESSKPRYSSSRTESSSRSDQQSKRDSSRSYDSSRISDNYSSAESYRPRDSSRKRDSSRSRFSSRRSHSRSRTDSSKSRTTSERRRSYSRPDVSSKTKGYASLETCRNETSSARDCFDFFLLTCYFPKAAALAAQKQGQEYHEDMLIDDWAIHGLWGFSYEYGEKLEEKCNNSINLSFDRELLSDDDNLKTELHKKWFSLYNKPGYTDEGFWKHEFNTHGRCLTRSSHVNDQTGYFELTLKLFNKADLKKTLADGGFVEGASITWAKMYEIIKKKHGAYPKIEQEFDRDFSTIHRRFYPKEIKLFYDHNLNPIDCPGNPHKDPNFQHYKFHYDVKLKKKKIESPRKR